MATLAIVSAILLAGCGPPPEEQLRQARAAMGNGQYDRALQLVERALRAEPNYFEAMWVRANVQIMLGQLDTGRRNVEDLIAQKPDDLESHELLIRWSTKKVEMLLKKPDYVSNVNRQRELKEALEVGHKQAAWLATVEGQSARASLLNARFADLEVASIDRMLASFDSTITREHLDYGSALNVEAVTRHLSQQRSTLLDQVESHVNRALTDASDYFDAYRFYSARLLARHRWRELWRLCAKAAGQHNVPADLVDQLVAGLLRAPSDTIGEERIETAAALVGAVAEADRRGVDYTVAEARVNLARRRYQNAQHLFAEIEHRQGQMASGRKRVRQLMEEAPMATARWLLGLGPGRFDRDAMVAWADDVAALDAMSDDLRLQWNWQRVRLLGEQQMWYQLMAHLDMMGLHYPKSAKIAACRMVLLLHDDRKQTAFEIYQRLPPSQRDGWGPLVAVLCDQPVDSAEREMPLSRFWRALLAADMDAARSAATSVGFHETFYRSDLLQIVNGPVRGQVDAQVARSLAVAYLAWQVQLGVLCQQLCTELIDESPELTLAHALVATVGLDGQRPVEHVSARVLRDIPESALGKYLSARVRFGLRDFAGAIDDLDALLLREPGHTHAQYEMAQAMWQWGRPKQAIEQLTPLAQAGPFRWVARRNLARLVAEESPDDLDRAAALLVGTPLADDPILRDTRGWIEHLRGRDHQAITELNRALDSATRRADVHYHLAVVYRALGNDRWARYHPEEALAGPTKPWTAQAHALRGELAH